jgi:hypothetical protein
MPTTFKGEMMDDDIQQAYNEARYVEVAEQPRNGDGFIGALDMLLERLDGEVSRLALLLRDVLSESTGEKEGDPPKLLTPARARIVRLDEIANRLSHINSRIDL